MREAAALIVGTFPAAQLCTRSVFTVGSSSLEPGFLEYFGLLYDWPIEVTMPDCLVTVCSPH